jgi:hypothetical protein
MEAICEATLLLMYTTCLLLRNDDDDAWDNEWVTRTGYGWLLVIMYVVTCPSPIFYSLYLRFKAQDQTSYEEQDFDSYENPLGDTADGITSTTSGANSVSNSEQRMRRAKQQQRKTKSLEIELAKAKALLAAQTQDKLRELNASGSGGIAGGVPYRLDTRRASQVSALKGLVEEKLVDQETAEKAQQRFSKRVLYAIETETHIDSLRELLNNPEVRLGHHTEAFVAVGGAGMVAEDVACLSDAEMAQVIERAQMTQMEARRLRVVVQRQQAKQQIRGDEVVMLSHEEK